MKNATITLLIATLALLGTTLLSACGDEEETREVTAADEAAEAAEEPAAEEPAEPPEDEGSAGVPRPIRTDDDGSTLYGTELDDALEVTALTALMEEPSRFDGEVVKTEGEIAQVCQRMGCWMELRPDDGEAAVRVPMAGHSFFLPRDVAGRRAVVQGRVQVRALPEGTQEHLREEGAQAADAEIGIEAVAVLVHASS